MQWVDTLKKLRKPTQGKLQKVEESFSFRGLFRELFKVIAPQLNVFRANPAYIYNQLVELYKTRPFLRV
jgi:hypothetical protein